MPSTPTTTCCSTRRCGSIIDLSQLRQIAQAAVPGSAISVSSVDGSSWCLSGAGLDRRPRREGASAGRRLDRQQQGAASRQPDGRGDPEPGQSAGPIAEVTERVLKSIGFNWPASATGVNSKRHGTAAQNIVSQQITTRDNIPVRILHGRSGRPTSSATLDALAQEGLITTLAEPNLTAVNGQTASFLAGGEFPIPVAASRHAGRRHDDHGRVQDLRRSARLHPDDPRRQPPEPEDPARGQPVDPERRGARSAGSRSRP